MGQLASRDLALDGIEKADEFEVAMALHAAANHGAVEHAERGEQGDGAVPLVIVRHGLAAPRLDRQSRLGAIERLDLALFVDRQHHYVGRRIDIEADDVGEFGGKAGSRDRLNVRSRCGCSLCARQMRCTEPTEIPMALAIARPVQWVTWCGGAVHVSVTPPPWFPPRSAPCQACGSCREANLRHRSRRSVVATATIAGKLRRHSARAVHLGEASRQKRVHQVAHRLRPEALGERS